MTGREFAELVRDELAEHKEWLGKKGRVFFSPMATIKPCAAPCSVYLMGTNPGGGETSGESIEEDLCQIERGERGVRSAFCDGKWSGRSGERIRKGVMRLVDALQLRIEDVPVTNLVFKRTKSEDELWRTDGDEWAKACWKVHLALMKRIQPRLLVIYGFEAFDKVKSLIGPKCIAGSDECHESPPRGKIRAFRWRSDGTRAASETLVLGLNHITRWALYRHCDAVAWVKALRAKHKC